MLNPLMDISEAETGAMNLELQSFRPGDPMDTAAEVYGTVAEDKGLSIHIRIDLPCQS